MRTSAVRTVGAFAAAVLLAAGAQVATAGTAPDPRQPLKRLTPADNARARSAVTRLADLAAGFRADAAKERAPLIPQCDAYPGDRSNVTVTGTATSSFLHRSNSIASTVLYFRTFADGERYWRATARAKYVDCLARLVPGLMVETATTSTLMAKSIAIGATSAERAVAYRTITRVEAPGVEPYTWSETVAFVKLGRAIGIVRVVYVNHLCECHTGLALDLTRRLRAAR
jgi:hypothetical protein